MDHSLNPVGVESMPVITDAVTIRRIGCMDILGAPNAKALFDGYAEHCLMPGPDPQVGLYRHIEEAGVLSCFGAYVDEELVGFATVIVSVMLHNGKRAASLESLFVERRYRDLHVHGKLLDAARDCARSKQCVVLTMASRVLSELATMLRRRGGCTMTHLVFTEWL